jgi:NAD(P)-dependent dehydrogenase (short-subunit alcohol dehydrogenase family)
LAICACVIPARAAQLLDVACDAIAERVAHALSLAIGQSIGAGGNPPAEGVLGCGGGEAMDIRQKGILITGASKGLGAALAGELASRGARLALVARGRERLHEIVSAIRASGGEAHAIEADVGDKESTYVIAGSAAALLGEIEVVIHNASTLGPVPMRLLLDTACEDLERVAEVNWVGPFRLTKALVGPMLLRGRGLVVEISSDAASVPYPRWGAYGASKAALDHLTRVWAAELEARASSSSRSIRARWTPTCTPLRCPTPSAARSRGPADVARRIADLIASDSFASGARLAAQEGALR